jgi:predicted DNA-binding protein
VKTLSLKLPDHLLARLETASRSRRMTKSALVRESLENALQEPGTRAGASCFDLARDLAAS